MDLEPALRAVANERRLEILDWLKDPVKHFRPQVDGDLIKDGVCGILIAEKLGVSQPTASEHLRILSHAGLIHGKRIKQWDLLPAQRARHQGTHRSSESKTTLKTCVEITMSSITVSK